MGFVTSNTMTSTNETDLAKAALTKKEGIERERSRTQIERFVFKKMPDWVNIGPGLILLGLFVLFFYMLYELYFSRVDFANNFGSNGGWIVAGVFFVSVFWGSGITEIEKSWAIRWGYKSEVPENERNVSLDEYWKHIGENGYATDHIYTDSPIEYYFYQISKTLYGLITIVLGILAAILGLQWLSHSLQQATPMNVVIFLLAAILWVLITKK